MSSSTTDEASDIEKAVVCYCSANNPQTIYRTAIEIGVIDPNFWARFVPDPALGMWLFGSEVFDLNVASVDAVGGVKDECSGLYVVVKNIIEQLFDNYELSWVDGTRRLKKPLKVLAVLCKVADCVHNRYDSALREGRSSFGAIARDLHVAFNIQLTAQLQYCLYYFNRSDVATAVKNTFSGDYRSFLLGVVDMFGENVAKASSVARATSLLHSFRLSVCYKSIEFFRQRIGSFPGDGSLDDANVGDDDAKTVTTESTDESDNNAATKCVVCYDRGASYAAVPCGHQCLCRRCAKKLREKKCPVCQGESTFIKIFNAGRVEDAKSAKSRSDRGDRAREFDDLSDVQSDDEMALASTAHERSYDEDGYVVEPPETKTEHDYFQNVELCQNIVFGRSPTDSWFIDDYDDSHKKILLKKALLQKYKIFKSTMDSNESSAAAIGSAKHELQKALSAVHNADPSIPNGDYEFAVNIVMAELESECDSLPDALQTLKM